jgi:integrase
VATEKVELTKLRLDNLRPAAAGKRYEIADTHVSGLRVRVGDAEVETGKFRGKAAQISFVLLARFPSKPNPNPTRRTLGTYTREYPELTLEAARQKAAQWKEMIKRGLDPSIEAKRELGEREAARRAAEEAVRKRRKVGDALNTYVTERLGHLRRGEATRRALDGREGLLCDLLGTDIRSIARQDIADAVRKRAGVAPISANRQLAYANAFFNWCVDEELIEQNPAARVRKPTREVSRDRYHTLEELREIWEAAGTLGYPFGPLYRLLIALPMRRDEVAGMPAYELELGADDTAQGIWTLPAARTKRANALRVPLSPLARSILADALNDPQRSKESPFVFTTTGKSAVSGFAKAKRRIDRAIEVARAKKAAELGVEAEAMPHWTVHDLRTTFNTHACERLNIDAAVADRVLNHVASATTSKIMRTYNRSELFEPRKQALFAWAALLTSEVAGGSYDDNVILLRSVAGA